MEMNLIHDEKIYIKKRNCQQFTHYARVFNIVDTNIHERVMVTHLNEYCAVASFNLKRSLTMDVLRQTV